MMKAIPPKFRYDEAVVKAKLACFNCGGNPEPETLMTTFCLFGSDESWQSLCESCYSAVDNKCECSGQSCLKVFKSSIQFIIEFYYVRCEECRVKRASRFTLDSYLPLCENCSPSYGVSEGLCELSYCNIEERFFKLLLECKNYLLKDRYKFIIRSSSNSCKAMLEGCRFLSQVLHNLFCFNHPNKIAEFLTSDLIPRCRLCTETSTNYFPISNYKETAAVLKDFLRVKASEVEPSCLSQYLIKFLKINGTIEVNNKKDISLLVLEGMDLIKKVDFGVVRCVCCVKKIFLGRRKGIKLNCGDVICYQCLASGVFVDCPLDMKELTYDEYFNSKLLNIPHCHADHKFDNDDVILKLPCFHYSCEKHIKEFCYCCGFEIRKFKAEPVNSNYAKSLVEFLEIPCPKHLLKIQYFSIFPLALKCEKCKNQYNEEQLLQYDQSPDLKGILEIFVKYMEMLKFKNETYDRICSDLTKIISNISLKNMSDLYTVIYIINLINFLECSVKTYQLFFFSKTINSRIYSKRLFKSNNSFKIVLRFKVKKDLICSGLILGLSFISYSIPNVPFLIYPKLLTYKKLLISNNEEILKKNFEFFIDQNEDDAIELNEKINQDLNGQFKNCRFGCSIYLESNQVYHEFIIDMNPGYYYVSKGSSKLRLSNIEYINIKKSDYGAGLVLNASISSPLFGILAAEMFH